MGPVVLRRNDGADVVRWARRLLLSGRERGTGSALERVRQEIAGIVGPRVAVVEIVPRVGPNGVVLTAECRTPLGPWRIEAEGASVVHAAGRLIERATEDRLAIAFREVVTAP